VSELLPNKNEDILIHDLEKQKKYNKQYWNYKIMLQVKLETDLNVFKDTAIFAYQIREVIN
jgi:hypothetical protein